jgi:7-cyano-7-deazaguanine reductase
MAKADGLSLPFHGLDAIRADMLEPIDYSGNEQTITLDYPEFSAVCPYSGLPDIARIILEYIPDKKIIELKSLKYYFISYRNVGIYQEDMTNRVYNDLIRVLNPRKLRVTTLYNIRGGIETRCVMGSI